MKRHRNLENLDSDKQSRLRQVQSVPGTGRTGDTISVRGVIHDFVDGKWVQRGNNGANAGALQQEIRVEVREREAADADFLTEAQINALIEAYGEPFTDALLSKLNGLEALRNAAQTYALIEASLNTAIANAIANFRTQAQINSAISTAIADFLTSSEITQAIADAIMAEPDDVGLTNAEVQTLIAAAVMDFLTETEISALIPDVSSFRTQAQINSAINTAVEDFLTETEISALIPDVSSFRTQAQINSAINTAVEDFLTETEISALIPDVSSFRTQAQINSAINTAVEDFLTETEISALIPDVSSFRTQAQINSAINTAVEDFLTETEISALIPDVSSFRTQAQINSAINTAVEDFLTETEISALIPDVSSFRTQAQINSAINTAVEDFLTETEISALIPDVSSFRTQAQINSAINTAVEDFLTETGINALIEAYGEPFTPALRDKLGGIEDDAKDDLTADEIIDLIEAQTGDERLDATHIRNIQQAQISATATEIRNSLESLATSERLRFDRLRVLSGTGIDFTTDSAGRTVISFDASDIAGMGLDPEDSERLMVNFSELTPVNINSWAEAIRNSLESLATSERLRFDRLRVLSGTGIDFTTDSAGRTVISFDASDIAGMGLDPEDSERLMVNFSELTPVNINSWAEAIRNSLESLATSERLRFDRLRVLSGTGIDFTTDSAGRTVISFDASDIAGMGLDPEDSERLMVNFSELTPVNINSWAEAIRNSLESLATSERLRFDRLRVLSGTGIDFTTDSAGRTVISFDASDIAGMGLDPEDSERLMVNFSELTPVNINSWAEAIRNSLESLGGNERLRFDRLRVLSGTGIDFTTDSAGRTVISADPTEFLVAGTGISFTNLSGGRIRIDAT